MRPFDLFLQLNSKVQTDQLIKLPVEMQFYISLIFLGLPDDIHEEKFSFLHSKKRITDGRTDRRTDRRTDGRTDGRRHPLIEMRGRI